MTEPDMAPLDVGIASRPCMGERVSGDRAFYHRDGDMLFAAVLDVLGHGPEAHAEALLYEQHIGDCWSPDVQATLTRLHERTQGGRGAALTAAAIEIDTGRLQVAGLGNVTLRILGRDVNRRAVTSDGVIGHRFRPAVAQTLTLERDCVLLLHSDGVSSSFTLEDYPQLPSHGATTIARTVLRRFGKSHDDATCLVVRYERWND